MRLTRFIWEQFYQDDVAKKTQFSLPLWLSSKTILEVSPTVMSLVKRASQLSVRSRAQPKQSTRRRRRRRPLMSSHTEEALWTSLGQGLEGYVCVWLVWLGPGV